MSRKPSKFPYKLTGCNLELTLACTLRCLHCGSRAGKARKNELTLKEWTSVAKQIIDLGCRGLTMIGGEVFLFSGWEKLAGYFVDHGVEVNIVSNGYQIGRREITQIKKAKLTNIGLSIDGMAENHNRMRGRDDAFSRLQKTLDLLNGEKIEIGAVTSLMKFNYPDLGELYAFLLANNVKIWQIQLVSSMGNASASKDERLSRKKIKKIVQFIREKNRARKMLVIAADSIGYFDDNEAYIRGRSSAICTWDGCSAGISNLFIDSVGNVKGCGALYSDVFIEGNVRQESLEKIWTDKKSFPYNRKFSTDLLAGRCKGCKVGEICKGGCRSANYFSTGSLYKSVTCARQG